MEDDSDGFHGLVLHAFAVITSSLTGAAFVVSSTFTAASVEALVGVPS